MGSLSEARILGSVGSILVVLAVIPIPLLGTALTLVGYVLVLIAAKFIADALENRSIFANYLLAALFAFLGVVVAGMLLIAALAQLPVLEELLQPLIPLPAFTESAVLNLLLGLLLALVSIWAAYIASAIFLRRSFASIAFRPQCRTLHHGGFHLSDWGGSDHRLRGVPRNSGCTNLAGHRIPIFADPYASGLGVSIALDSPTEGPAPSPPDRPVLPEEPEPKSTWLREPVEVEDHERNGAKAYPGHWSGLTPGNRIARSALRGPHRFHCVSSPTPKNLSPKGACMRFMNSFQNSSAIFRSSGGRYAIMRRNEPRLSM